MKKCLNKIVCLLLSFTMLFSISAGVDFSAVASAVYGDDVIAYARQYLGCKYGYAQQGPDKFDCSGFVHYVYKHFGISLPTSSGEYWNNSSAIGEVIAENSIANAQAGDIVSWYNSKAKHVAIVTEDGYLIESANSRLGVVERKYDLVKANGNYKVIRVYGVEKKQPIKLSMANNVTASKITGISAKIKWNPVEYADGYQIQLLSSPTGEWQNVGFTAVNEFDIRNLTFNHNYSVRVKAYRYKNNDDSDKVYADSWSYACGFKTLSKEESAKNISTVDYIRFSGATQNSVNVLYNAVAGANMYQIQCSADNVNWKTVLNTSNTYATLTGFEKDSLYYVRIMAYAKSGNESALSNKYSESYRFFTSPSNEVGSLSFNDLSDWQNYNGYVAYTSLYNSYILGTNPPEYTEFSPTESITRAMFVTILYRMAGEPYKNANPYTESPFTDITDTEAYYYDSACWALDKGITTQTTFKPFDNVNREQTASFLFRYAQTTGKVGDTKYKSVNLKSYPDYSSVHSWAVEPLQWSNYNGMITGTSQGYINPQGDTQRIHATKILYRFGKTCTIGNFE